MRQPSANFRVALALSVAASLLLGGCATPADPYAAVPARGALLRDDAIGDCMRKVHGFDARIDAVGMRDAQTRRVEGYPYLRADRFSAFASPPAGADAAAVAKARVDRMAALDGEARSYEAANARISPQEFAEVERCRAELVADSRSHAQAVTDAAQPPDAYDDALRVIGLYPLTRIPFSWGVASWQQTTRDLYATPFPELPVRGQRLRYVPGEGGPGPVAGLLAGDHQAGAVLGVPPMDAEHAWKLLQQHAPVFVVDVADDDDRIGRLVWRMSGTHISIDVDERTPTAYARVAWTQVGGNVVPQLVYTFWFKARPASHALDLVAGHLDAVVWRVTLDAEGRPLVYDSIHACGCFHMFFPTQRVRERPGPLDHEGPFDETLFAPQVMHTPDVNERVIIFVGSADHNIQRVAVDALAPAPGVPYRIVDENTLRMLPLPAAAGGGTRSIYGPDGLVPGSERPERFIFWPMGVPSAGQMRQWGHHATAFIGRRHFDDPRLIDRYFTIAPSAD